MHNSLGGAGLGRTSVSRALPVRGSGRVWPDSSGSRSRWALNGILRPQGAVPPDTNPPWRGKIYRLAPKAALLRGMLTGPEAFFVETRRPDSPCFLAVSCLKTRTSLGEMNRSYTLVQTPKMKDNKMTKNPEAKLTWLVDCLGFLAYQPLSKTFLFQAIQFIQTVLIQLIQFSIRTDFVYTQLDIKTVLY